LERDPQLGARARVVQTPKTCREPPVTTPGTNASSWLMLRRSALVLSSCSLATALLGCVAVPPTPTGPAGSPATNQPVGLGPTPGAASTVPSSAFGRLPECPAFRFDDGAKLGPVFQADIFQHDESHDLAAVFVEELQGLYAGSSDVNACDAFSR